MVCASYERFIVISHREIIVKMADNYLEKQREAYEARKAEWLKSKKKVKCSKQNLPKSNAGNGEYVKS